MEKLLDAAAQIIAQNGPPALIIAALAYVIYRLAGLYHECQENRIKEGRETVTAVSANTAALDALSALIREKIKG